MVKVHGFWLALPIALAVVAASCVGGGVFLKERLTDRFAFWAVDGLQDNALVEESADGRGARVIIEPTVFAAGFNSQFIIAKRHPKSGFEFDRTKTEYYVVSIRDGDVYGPVTSEAFSALRAKLGVPPGLDFSRVFQQLASGQPSNRQLEPTALVADSD
jgi:hypothetical protein